MAVSLFKAIWNAPLRPHEKLVLIRLADRVNEHALQEHLQAGAALPGATPGLRSVIADCGMSSEGVQEILRRCAAAGVIRIEAASTKRPRTYFILVERAPDGSLQLPEAGVRALVGALPHSTRRAPSHSTPENAGALSDSTAETAGALSSSTRDTDAGEARCAVGTVAVCCGNGSGVLSDSTKPEEPDQPGTETGAGAPGRAPSRRTRTRGVPPFKVFAAIASAALEQSIREDGTDNFANVAAFFKARCAARGFTVDGDITRRAVEAVLHVKRKAQAVELQRDATASHLVRCHECDWAGDARDATEHFRRTRHTLGRAEAS